MKTKVCQVRNFFCVVTLILNLFCIAQPNSVHAQDCRDVEFIFARGSGETLNDRSFNAWKQEITNQLSSSTLTYDFYELGSNPSAPFQYPATAVSGGLWDYVNLASAYFSGGEAFEFGASVEQGITELSYQIATTSALCPQTKFVLGGYSQGAMVVTKTLAYLNAERIIFVTNFGDPKLYLPEGNNLAGIFPKVPDACRGQNLSEYRTHVPDCRAYEGVLGSQRPYRTSEYVGKVGTWCNKSDIMCSSGMSIGDHTSYTKDNLYADAARRIYQKLAHAFPAKFPDQKPLKLHDVAFVLDATGSMQDLMRLYRDELKNLAHQVYASGGRVAIYAYKDSLTQKSSWLMSDFGDTEEWFYRNFGKYTASDGGDAKESLLSALHYAMKELNWQWGATKSIVVVTDDGYKEPDFEGVTVAQVIRESLEIDPVNIYVVAPENFRETYRELTTQTGGKFFGLNPRLDDTVLTENLAIIQDSTPQILDRPTAKLSAAEYYGGVGDEFTFDASESYGYNGAELAYSWDLDGDGAFEQATSSPRIHQIYQTAFEGFVQVRVSDGEKSSTMSAEIEVVPADNLEFPASITDLSYLMDGDSAKVTFTTAAQNTLVSLGDAPFGFVQSEGGQGEFTINNVTHDLTVTLTPYSASGRRGINRTLEIEVQSDEVSTSPDENNSPADVEQPPVATPEPITPSQTTSSSQSSKLPNILYPLATPTSAPNSKIPSAPNAGAYHENSNANGRHIRIYKHLTSAPHGHTAQQVLPLPLLLVSHSKPSDALPPNTSVERAHDK